MTITIENASETFAKALRQMAKLDGATVKTQRKSALQESLAEIERGDVEIFDDFESFKAAMEE